MSIESKLASEEFIKFITPLLADQRKRGTGPDTLPGQRVEVSHNEVVKWFLEKRPELASFRIFLVKVHPEMHWYSFDMERWSAAKSN